MPHIKEQLVLSLIEKTGLSLRAWALQHGFTQQIVYAWTHGVRSPSNGSLLQLASALRVSPDDIKADPTQLELDKRDICELFNEMTDSQRWYAIRAARKIIYGEEED